MVSRDRAAKAVRALAPPGSTAPLLVFVDSFPAEELAQWSIQDTDDDKVIFDYIAARRARDGQHPQAAPSLAPSSTQPRQSDITTWWPAGWLGALAAPLWSHVCGDDEPAWRAASSSSSSSSRGIQLQRPPCLLVHARS
ncbi:hypothetical protein HXX76_010880 [Chlamydomonas incerta]|uniref:Uncharacterized protein n=1 Tax=Chlamydomonas incerta TaxID=51695 RepID=A0A835SWI2_CHLIN|nr:hypothetical protein HXX76_010880 [Chlamydomonas incerta]|eukprot:KAG2427161.1 hypothetical protein HXX76_010880 [Chlamydomonas incerta]